MSRLLSVYALARLCAFVVSSVLRAAELESSTESPQISAKNFNFASFFVIFSFGFVSPPLVQGNSSAMS